MLNKCLLCGGKLNSTRENVVERVLGYVFEFKNVPVLKCSECGEVHFSAEVNEFIEEYISNKVKQEERLGIDFNNLEKHHNEAAACEFAIK